MSVLKYLQNCEVGIGKNGSSRNSRGESLNVDFLLQRLKSRVDDVFVVRGEDEEEVPPTATRFCPKYGQEHTLAVANEAGGIALLNTQVSAKKGLLTKWNAHTNAIFDVCWSGSQLLTASGDKTVKLWDTVAQEHICTMKGHTSSVKTIDLQPYSSSVFATGSRDGNIMVWDIRSRTSGDHHLPVIVIHNAHDAHSTLGISRHRRRVLIPERICVVSPLNAVSSILYQNEHLLLSAGASDSDIKLWDLRTSKKESTLRKKISIHGDTKPKGYSSMALHPSHTTFFANGVDGVIYQYSCSTSDLVATYYGHKVNTYFVKMATSGDGRFIISGSSDEKAYIWRVSKPGPPIVALSGHLDEVTSVAWCPADFSKVVTCSDDAQVLCWNVHLETPLHNKQGRNTFLAEAEEIDHEATKPPPAFSSLMCRKPKAPVKTPRSESSTYSPVLTRWLTPQRTAEQTLTPINMTPVKRTFTLPKKRHLSDEDEENGSGSSKRVPRSPNSKNVLTQRQCITVARRLNSSFASAEPIVKLGESSKKSQPTSTKSKKKKSNTPIRKDRPVLNSIKNYFQVLSRT